MPYKMYWEKEPSIFIVDYIGVTSVEDVSIVAPRCMELASQHPLYLMVDFSQSQGFEPAVLKYPPLLKLMRDQNIRWWAFVGMKGMYKFAFQILMRFAAVKIFETREEALAFLADMAQQQMEKPEAAQIPG